MWIGTFQKVGFWQFPGMKSYNITRLTRSECAHEWSVVWANHNTVTYAAFNRFSCSVSHAWDSAFISIQKNSYYCMIVTLMHLVFLRAKPIYVWLCLSIRKKKVDGENRSAFKGNFWWLASQSLCWYWCVNGILQVKRWNAVAFPNSTFTLWLNGRNNRPHVDQNLATED